MTREPLTGRQQEIYDYIRSHIVAEQRPPSYREIMARFEFSSPNGVKHHLRAMEKKGWIDLGTGHKAIKLTGVTVRLEDE